MCERKKPIFGTVFDVIFYTIIACGIALLVKDSVEGKLELWQNVLLVAVGLGCLVEFYLKRRKRRAKRES